MSLQEFSQEYVVRDIGNSNVKWQQRWSDSYVNVNVGDKITLETKLRLHLTASASNTVEEAATLAQIQLEDEKGS